MIRWLLGRIVSTRESKLVVVVALFSATHLMLLGPVPLPGGRGTLLVLEWTLTALVGIGYSGWFVRDTLLDLEYQQRSGANGTTELAALILIILAALLLVIHLLFFELGLPGLLSPPSPDAASAGSRTLGTQFTVVGQLLVYGLALVHRFRGQLLTAYTRRSP